MRKKRKKKTTIEYRIGRVKREGISREDGISKVQAIARRLRRCKVVKPQSETYNEEKTRSQ